MRITHLISSLALAATVTAAILPAGHPGLDKRQSKGLGGLFGKGKGKQTAPAPADDGDDASGAAAPKQNGLAKLFGGGKNKSKGKKNAGSAKPKQNPLAALLGGGKNAKGGKGTAKSGKGWGKGAKGAPAGDGDAPLDGPAGGSAAKSPAMGVMNQITRQLGDMKKSIAAFTGETITAVPLLDSASAILATIKSGTDGVMAGGPLGLLEVVAILGPLASLNSAVGQVTQALLAKKPQFDEAGLTFIVFDQLEGFNIEAKKLVDAILGKMPAYLPKGLTGPFAQPIVDKLQQAVDSFKGS
jgi:hypothetical protein